VLSVISGFFGKKKLNGRLYDCATASVLFVITGPRHDVRQSNKNIMSLSGVFFFITLI